MYFAYARVSTPRQGERGVSLQEQRDAIERYARVHGLEIARWFEDRESASHTGRTAFGEMLRLLRLGKVQGVVIHKIDRSARNLDDWVDVGKLVDAGVQVHFAAENVDLKTVAGRLSADIQAVVAAHYSRNLRDEVKKGLYGRLKQGFYPLRAPIGYLDQGSAKAKIPDATRAPFIRQAFDLYGSGKFSLPLLCNEMFARGLRNLRDGPVTINGMTTLLRNAFYIGLMRIQKTGQTFEGIHEPLVTPELFEKVQTILAGKRVDRSNSHVFTYSRMVKCGSCGYSLIGEKKKGIVYYRCHNRPFKTPAKCPSTSVREEMIDQAIRSKLSDVNLSDEEIELGRIMLKSHREDADKNRESRINGVQIQIESIRMRLAKATDLLMDGTIDKSLFETKQRELLIEQAKLRSLLAELEKGGLESIRRIETTVELAKSPSIQHETAVPQKKRELSKILLSNLTVSQKNIDVTLALPFNLIAERDKLQECRPCRGSCRTWEQILTHLIQEAYSEARLKKAA
jgi:DNA invertase Pin-like site-specific DNA recombinase